MSTEKRAGEEDEEQLKEEQDRAIREWTEVSELQQYVFIQE